MRSMAARLGVSRNTVAKAAASGSPPRYGRAAGDSAIRAMEPKIRALLKDNSVIPATVIAERVGWSGSPAWFRENVARVRPVCAPADPADRISYQPGALTQGRQHPPFSPSRQSLWTLERTILTEVWSCASHPASSNTVFLYALGQRTVKPECEGREE
ncbi:hypothetical protein [Arthrobacter sp. UYCu723]